MSMHEFELHDGTTPRYHACAGRALRKRAVVASCNGLCILCPHAYPTTAFTRASTAARAYAPTRAHPPQGRATAPPYGQTHRQAAAGAQAAGVAHARAAVVTATHAGVGDDRGRVHERRHGLLALP